MCIRFGLWSSRPMGDIDFYIQNSARENAYELLAQLGWTPMYGMTWPSLLQRMPSRRQSWNLTNGRSNIDVHWGLERSIEECRLTQAMWGSAMQTDFLGRAFLLQSPEFALQTSLRHGFFDGTSADNLQTLVDTASLLPICDTDVLKPLLCSGINRPL